MRRKQSATFRYTGAYLAHPGSYDLDPALPRSTGVFQTDARLTIFNAFSDSGPDRWGQNLLRREERERATEAGSTPRELLGADFLLGVRDDVRQGALRYRDPGSGKFLSSHHGAVPKLMDVARLLGAVDKLDAELPLDRDIKDLIDAGGSLGGARPKAAVTTSSGGLAIAKFPRKGSDEWDVIGWESLEMELAAKCGIHVAATYLVDAGPRKALIVERFDRKGSRRIGFSSALTMLEAADGEQHSYLDIVDVIEQHSSGAGRDLEGLFRRVAFSILTGNTDDHLRNHGSLRAVSGWALSPAYDLNPNPDSPSKMSTTVGYGDDAADLELLLSTSGYYRLSDAKASSIISGVESATRNWRKEAQARGMPDGQIQRMESAFDTAQ
ncbi:HipA domain-containing protein [Micrococcaceae bacterium Sec5.7]